MAILNSWQRIDRVLRNKPYGDKSAGDATVSSDINTRKSCSGSSAQKNLTIGSSGYTDGDVVLIHQSRGTGVGQWEINRVASGGGTTTLVMQENLQYTYTDSGASQAQVINIPMYRLLTISAFSSTVWNQDVNGFFVVAAQAATISGALNADNTGHRGGAGQGGGGGAAYRGEGTNADIDIANAALGSAGGGGDATTGAGSLAGGGGGGNGAVGGAGGGINGAVGGGAGQTGGAADLTNMVHGGGGGGSSQDGNGPPSTGGIGGGIVIIISKSIIITGNIYARGQAGQFGSNTGGGGGGAGGSILLVCETATLGSGLIVATGGAGNAGSTGGSEGGNGGTGRIAVHHSGIVTGTTSPTFTDVTDLTLKEPLGGAFLLTQFL